MRNQQPRRRFADLFGLSLNLIVAAGAGVAFFKVFAPLIA